MYRINSQSAITKALEEFSFQMASKSRSTVITNDKKYVSIFFYDVTKFTTFYSGALNLI
jgi:hypothetical protein